MTELALFELMSEADCELLARSDVRVKVHRRIGLRVLLIAASSSQSASLISSKSANSVIARSPPP